mgnify:CR=1 FL=1
MIIERADFVPLKEVRKLLWEKFAERDFENLLAAMKRHPEIIKIYGPDGYRKLNKLANLAVKKQIQVGEIPAEDLVWHLNIIFGMPASTGRIIGHKHSHVDRVHLMKLIGRARRELLGLAEERDPAASPPQMARPVAAVAAPFQPTQLVHEKLGVVRVTRHAYEQFVERFYQEHKKFLGDLSDFWTVQTRMQFVFGHTEEVKLSPEARVIKLIIHRERASFWDNKAYNMRFVVAETPDGPELRTAEIPEPWRPRKPPTRARR